MATNFRSMTLQCIDCGDTFVGVSDIARHVCKNDTFAQAEPAGTEDDHKSARADFDRRMEAYHGGRDQAHLR